MVLFLRLILNVVKKGNVVRVVIVVDIVLYVVFKFVFGDGFG